MRIEVEGTCLWFDVDGPGLVPEQQIMRTRPTVVLLHGGPGGFDHSYLKPDFGRLTEIAQVVYLDLPGHGRSDWGSAEHWTFEWAGDLIRAFCEALEIGQPIVFGHSFGGSVAISYGSRHPDHPGGLILQSTMARFDLDRVVDGFRDEHRTCRRDQRCRPLPMEGSARPLLVFDQTVRHVGRRSSLIRSGRPVAMR